MPVPQNYTFVATYGTSINAEKGTGILTGTATGGASIVSSKLDLAHGDIRYVDYAGLGNVSGTQIGAIKGTFETAYSGTPANDHTFFTECYAPGDQKNLISLTHSSSDGKLYPLFKDSTGIAINIDPIGLFNPISGTPCELELNYNLTTGDIYTFVQGEVLGHITGATGTRDSNVSLIRVGSSYESVTPDISNFKVSNFIMFDSMQHTARYTPGYNLGWALETTPYLVTVYGWVKNPSDIGVAGVTVVATAQSKYNYDNLQIYSQNYTATTNSDGYWEMSLVDTTTSGILYTITFTQGAETLKQYTDIKIPNTSNLVAFSDLV